MLNQALKRHKRNRAIVVLLFPVVAILWFFGWSLYWAGSKRLTKLEKRTRHEGLIFTVLTPEQEYAK
jgi:hypothetical protein